MVEPKTSELERVWQDVEDGKEPSVSVREMLRWFGFHRRGTAIVDRVETELEEAGLETDPHFTTVWIDAPITFRKRGTDSSAAAGTAETGGNTEQARNSQEDDELPEAIYLVRMLEAANREVIYVRPEQLIETAITKMMANDFSQLAVMGDDGNRNLKGTISWKSIGSRLIQRNKIKHVSNAMERASEVLDTASLFEATRKIIQSDYVFVRSSRDNKITGIVTATDLSEQFLGLSEPFLLLGQIEKQIRRIITEGQFDLETLQDACHDNDPDRKKKITGVSDLTFGEYQRILEKEENWKKLRFVADRKIFCGELDSVRKLRNDIMHFHPDEVDDEDYYKLRCFSRLLDQLEKLSG